MCKRFNKQAWCKAGKHGFGEIKFYRLDKCWEVNNTPGFNYADCKQGIVVSNYIFDSPEVEKCEVCEAAETEDADQADDEASGADDDDDAAESK
ncbi:hypothetical protein Hte_008775 [Hypoxylon texense]